jgi:hypothetical protein
MSEEVESTATTEDNVTPIRPIGLHPGVTADLENARSLVVALEGIQNFLCCDCGAETQHFELLRAELLRHNFHFKSLVSAFIESYDVEERRKLDQPF